MVFVRSMQSLSCAFKKTNTPNDAKGSNLIIQKSHEKPYISLSDYSPFNGSHSKILVALFFRNKSLRHASIVNPSHLLLRTRLGDCIVSRRWHRHQRHWVGYEVDRRWREGGCNRRCRFDDDRHQVGGATASALAQPDQELENKWRTSMRHPYWWVDTFEGIYTENKMKKTRKRGGEKQESKQKYQTFPQSAKFLGIWLQSAQIWWDFARTAHFFNQVNLVLFFSFSFWSASVSL